ncbi:MAG: FKBP-type peptidyl-prolyl cis-trans isomerase [Bacteroidota bacterium]
MLKVNQLLSIFCCRVSLLACLLFLVACGGGADTSAEKAPSFTPPTVNEDDLIGRLSTQMVADPVSQADQDQNTIINYAIDKRLDVYRTPSGLYIQLLETGEGPAPTRARKVVAHYKGSLMDGTVFDSSYKRSKPLEFQLGQVIAGWQEGLSLLKPGGKAILLVPSGLAYGPAGRTGIPPNAVLRFDVELLEVK